MPSQSLVALLGLKMYVSDHLTMENRVGTT